MSTLGTLLRDGLRLAVLQAPRDPLIRTGLGPILILLLLDEVLALPQVWVLLEAPRTFSIHGLAAVLVSLAVLLLAAAALIRLTLASTNLLTVTAWLIAAGLGPTLAGSLLALITDTSRYSDLIWSGRVLWWCAILLRMALYLAPNVGRALAGMVSAALISILPWLVLDVPTLIETDWLAYYEQSQGDDDDYSAYREPGELDDAEAVFYAQPALLESALQRLAPQRPGTIDLYVVGFAGDASEGAFRNEVDFLPELAAHRLDAQDRVLRLVNHPGSATQVPLATVTNLERALQGIGERMDVNEDVLFLYLTSHGSEYPLLYVNQPPLPLDQLDPERLRDALDQAGIRWRVIVISACYSGGFIDALRGPRTLVITAARADRTSFGCGNSANATWFGQAFLIDGLNHNANFRRAYLRARHQIDEREQAEEFDPSEPQWMAGKAIAAHLAHWAETLPAGITTTFVPSVQVIHDEALDDNPPETASTGNLED